MLTFKNPLEQFSIPGGYVLFNCHAFLVSSNLGQFLSLSLSFLTLTFGKVLVSCWVKFLLYDEMLFCQEHHRSEVFS